jgi:hypothetical protein
MFHTQKNIHTAYRNATNAEATQSKTDEETQPQGKSQARQNLTRHGNIDYLVRFAFSLPRVPEISPGLKVCT